MGTATLEPVAAIPPVKMKPEPGLKHIDIGLIVPSQTNPRRKRDHQKDLELLDSVLQDGVIQPIVLRPAKATAEHLAWYEKRIATIRRESSSLARQFSDKATFVSGSEIFEIVAGERRWEAAFKAGLVEIPAVVRELSDEKARFIQIIENLQRADISPVDESRSFRELLAQGKTAEEIAKSIGKGRSSRYVYARAKLGELLPGIQEALEVGRISAGHGDLLVRLQPEGQKRALRWIEDMEKRTGQAPVVRALDEWIKMYIHIPLDSAPWKKDDAKLVPQAGACTDCKKNSAVQPELFPESKRPTCTDPDCFSAKTKAHEKLVQIEQSKAVERERKHEPSRHSINGAAGAEIRKMAKSQPATDGGKNHQKLVRDLQQQQARQEKADRARESKLAVESKTEAATFVELSKKAQIDPWVLAKLGPEILFEAWDAGLSLDSCAQSSWGWPAPKNGLYDYLEVRKYSQKAKLNSSQVLALMLWSYSKPDTIGKVFKHFKIDAAAIRRKVVAQVKQEDKQAAAQKAEQAKPARSVKTPAKVKAKKKAAKR